MYELFETTNKEQYLLISATLQSQNPGSFATTYAVARDLIYIVELKNEYRVYYASIGGERILNSYSYDNGNSGIFINKLDFTNKCLFAKRINKDGSKDNLQIKIHLLD